MKKLILFLPFILLASCANPPAGYDGAKMADAIRTMNEVQTNTRVFNATGFNPHF